MKKLIIANEGTAVHGKTTSIKKILKDLLLKNGASSVPGTTQGNWNSDIRMIVEYQGIRIGIESQGDPNSRIFNSIPYFVQEECDIIVCACRTYGQTHDLVANQTKYGYDIIWASNPKLDNKNPTSIDRLNTTYAEMVIKIINDRIAGQI